ncbi:beta-1,4-galactosyltransferase 4-like [Daphnia pulicaria]|uniref:beta-1,4-galactosyltransferase 4-like n=1 Tax=Daphnia pulicaria TaxID=35523 RepID=UPI001EEACFAC|nr:beta-1,4-galactosyltransferase 4-like [Daphnia pulicaria]
MFPRCRYATNATPIRILVLGVPLVAVLCYFYFFLYASNYSCIHPWFIVSDRKNNQSYSYPWTDANCGWQITPPCPNMIPSQLVEWRNLSLETTIAILKEDEDAVQLKMTKSGIKVGGKYKPVECQSQHKVAVVVPVRNRTDHLTVFLRYMHPFLQRQQLNYIIIVVEQSEKSPFNRGMLMNIGFKEAQLLQENFQCFIFHDVDLLPEYDGNPYTCPEDGKPRQMAFSVDSWNYKPTSANHFGGVTALSTNDFQSVNGFSNSFWGWGGEDDQLYQRVKSQNLNVTRAFDEQPSLIHLARYKTLSHKKASPNPDRMQVIKEGPSRFKTDGLVDLRYKRLDFQFKPLYTHILVDIQPNSITQK